MDERGSRMDLQIAQAGFQHQFDHVALFFESFLRAMF